MPKNDRVKCKTQKIITAIGKDTDFQVKPVRSLYLMDTGFSEIFHNPKKPNLLCFVWWNDTLLNKQRIKELVNTAIEADKNGDRIVHIVCTENIELPENFLSVKSCTFKDDEIVNAQKLRTWLKGGYHPYHENKKDIEVVS